MQETWVQFLGPEVPLEKEMATHSSILAWRIPWTEEPGRLQPMESQRVGHNLALSFFLYSIARESVTISCVLLGIQKIGREVGKLYSEKSGRRQVHSGWRSLKLEVGYLEVRHVCDWFRSTVGFLWLILNWNGGGKVGWTRNREQLVFV